MNSKITVLVLFILFGLQSCKKDQEEVAPVICNPALACSDTVPDEPCLAAFNRYFYDAETKSCEQIGYSGCDAYGFETLAECQECDCVE